MGRSGRGWAPVDRMKDESHTSWVARAHRAHVEDWAMDRVRDGSWLPPDEYLRVTGRPGLSLGAALDTCTGPTSPEVPPSPSPVPPLRPAGSTGAGAALTGALVVAGLAVLAAFLGRR